MCRIRHTLCVVPLRLFRCFTSEDDTDIFIFRTMNNENPTDTWIKDPLTSVVTI